MGNRISSTECEPCGAGLFHPGTILKSLAGVHYMKTIGGIINLHNGETHGNGSAYYNNAKFTALSHGSALSITVE